MICVSGLSYWKLFIIKVHMCKDHLESATKHKWTLGALNKMSMQLVVGKEHVYFLVFLE